MQNTAALPYVQMEIMSSKHCSRVFLAAWLKTPIQQRLHKQINASRAEMVKLKGSLKGRKNVINCTLKSAGPMSFSDFIIARPLQRTTLADLSFVT